MTTFFDNKYPNIRAARKAVEDLLKRINSKKNPTLLEEAQGLIEIIDRAISMEYYEFYNDYSNDSWCFESAWIEYSIAIKDAIIYGEIEKIDCCFENEIKYDKDRNFINDALESFQTQYKAYKAGVPIDDILPQAHPPIV